MNNKLFLIIKTNSYVGNFDRELMTYVFGYDNNGDAQEEYEMFENDVGEKNIEMFEDYLDIFAFGEHDSEYSCYKIESHPTNKEYNCDSFYVCLKRKLPKELAGFVAQRLNGFCDYYNKKYNKNLQIEDVNYYQNKFAKVDEETF